jgi:VCBS repeat-containing protein
MNMLRQTLGTVAGMAAVFMLAAPAQAADYYLRAAPVDKAMPDGTVVTMWGFALDDDGDFATIEHQPTVPGPRLSVPAGDTILNVHLYNALPPLNGAPTPVSLVIMGQQAVMSPVSVADAQGRTRVRSFTHETLPGTTGVYTWNALTPGTYLYQSGTQPAVQVQMGLYGAVTQDASAGEAYVGLAYQHEVTLLYSEIDTALHAAVASDNYGPGKAMTSTIDYLPRYFLVNGEPHTPAATPLPAGNVGETTLVRFLNAGLQTHVPLVQGLHMQLVAEDGKPFPYPREQYSALLPAGKTIDALLTPAAEGSYAVYDRRLRLTSGRNAPGGLFATLAVSAVPSAPQALNDDYATDEDVALTVPAPGVLANDTDPDGNPLSAALVDNVTHGMLALNADGSFTYTPSADFGGTDTFTYQANDGTLNSTVATVTITVNAVNDAPTAAADVATLDEDTSAVIDVLANDTDPEGATLVVTAVSTPTANGGSVTINADNTVTYTPATNYAGADSFTYTVSDGEMTSDGVVSLTVTAVNDAPTAQTDTVETTVNSDVMIDVLANDSDVDGDALTLVSVGAPLHGTKTVMGSVIHYYPPADFTGTDTFTYQVGDGVEIATEWVTITVTAADAGTLGSVTTPVASGLTVDEAVFKDKAGTKRDEWVIAGQSTAPGSTVTLFLGPNLSGATIGTAAVGNDGSWSFRQRATVQPDGSNTISVQSSTGAQLHNVPLTIDR